MADENRSIRTCSYCDAPLKHDDVTCPFCGRDVPESTHISISGEDKNSNAASAASAVRVEEDPFQGFDIIAGEPISNNADQALEVQSVATSTHTAGSEVPKKSKSVPIFLIIAALVLVLIGVLLAFAAHENSSLYLDFLHKSPDASQQDGVGAGQDAQQQSEDAEQDVLNNDEIYDALVASYNNIEGYLDTLMLCVDDFNAGYALKDKDARVERADAAKALQASIHEELKNLDSLNVPAQNMYAQDRLDLQGMYQAFDGRIAPLVKAWDVSLQYDNPYAYSDEILSELSKDYVGGKNPNIELFDTLYYGHKPVKKH